MAPNAACFLAAAPVSLVDRNTHWIEKGYDKPEKWTDWINLRHWLRIIKKYFASKCNLILTAIVFKTLHYLYSEAHICILIDIYVSYMYMFVFWCVMKCKESI